MRPDRPRLLRVLAALAAAACVGMAQAGSVQLTVTDKDGKPAPDVVVLIQPAVKGTVLPAAAPVVIAQQDLRFVPFLTVVPVGSTLRFVNRDGYDHHVRSTPSGPLGSTPAASNFELRLDAATAAGTPSAAAKRGGDAAEVKVDTPGAIGLGCHLHSSMRGQVYVSDTPWFGKTDANGTVTIEGVPDGAAEATLWHADQLQAQPSLRLAVTAAPTSAAAQLNFTPRRRRG